MYQPILDSLIGVQRRSVQHVLYDIVWRLAYCLSNDSGDITHVDLQRLESFFQLLCF